MLSRALHFLAGHLLVISHCATLHLFELLQVLLSLTDVIVKLNHLSNCFSIGLGDLLRNGIDLLSQSILLRLELAISRFKSLVAREDVI